MHTLQCQGTINDTMASVHGLEQDGQQEGSRRAAGGQQQGEDQLNRDNRGTMRRGTGGQHLLDIEEEEDRHNSDCEVR